MIECVPSTKLIGGIVSQDTKWFQNTTYICKKARGKLWIMRRMLELNLDISQLFDVFVKEIRSILEMAVPVWHSDLTKKQADNIESIQKTAMKIILQENYSGYDMACNIFSTQTLKTAEPNSVTIMQTKI